MSAASRHSTYQRRRHRSGWSGLGRTTFQRVVGLDPRLHRHPCAAKYTCVYDVQLHSAACSSSDFQSSPTHRPIAEIPHQPPRAYARVIFFIWTDGESFFFSTRIMQGVTVLVLVLVWCTSFMSFSGHTSHFQHSFFPQVVALWNTLPSALTSAQSLKIYTHSFHYSDTG